jgi:hypothetical protein
MEYVHQFIEYLELKNKCIIYREMEGLLYIIIQIIFALLLVFMLLFLANMIYNYETVANIRNSYVIKREIPIFSGYIDYSQTVWTYDTYDKSKSSFKDLTPSINQNGGAEYTYNFWLYMDKSILGDVTKPDIVLLLRGNTIQLPYLNNTNCEIANHQKYVLVKNPLIRLESNGSAMVVEYNTVTNPDSYRENGQNVIDCSGSWMDQNKGMLGIYNMDDHSYDKKWFMVTIVLREVNPDNDILYKNKTSCKIYINGINVQDRTVESPYNGSYGSAAMRHNRGPLFVNPTDIFGEGQSIQSGKTDALKMANLTYFNYALTESDVMQVFGKKFSKQPASPPAASASDGIDQYAIATISRDNSHFPKQF